MILTFQVLYCTEFWSWHVYSTVLYSTLRSHVTESSRHRIVTRMASSHTKLSSKKCRIFRMGPIHLVWPPCILCVRSVTLHTFCMVPCFLYENPAPCILYVMCLQNRDTTLIYPDSVTWDLSVQENLNWGMFIYPYRFCHAGSERAIGEIERQVLKRTASLVVLSTFTRNKASKMEEIVNISSIST